MTCYAALLPAENVGGSRKLAMADLRAMCSGISFMGIVTYIVGGSAMFWLDLDAREVKARLETRLTAHAGNAVSVMVRDVGELRLPWQEIHLAMRWGTKS
jgi:uncharacterized protein (DUF1697 family)